MLTRRIILNLIISMGFTSYLVYEIVVKVIEEEEIGQYEEILDNTNQQIRRVMSDVYVGTINHIDEIENNLDQPEKMYDIMKRIVERNPRIRSCGISFIDTYYPKKGRWFAPYAVREKDSTIVTRNIGGPNYDYLNSGKAKKVLGQNLSSRKTTLSYHSSPAWHLYITKKVKLLPYLEPICHSGG